MTSDYIVGMMWNRNEGDILEEVIIDALKYVDSMFIADGQSTDQSWKIIESLKSRYPDKIEHIQQESETGDKAQRNSLLHKIRDRYKPENTWVQIFESDIFILDTDLRALVKNPPFPSKLGITWQLLNCVRLPGTWKEVDTYPTWNQSIRNLMPYVHHMEAMLYTFRPLPKLYYSQDFWRPWPNGWSYYEENVKYKAKKEDSPLLLHVGYRGPTHFYCKYKHMGKNHKKYLDWTLENPGTVEATVPFFSGMYNSRLKVFNPTRENWIAWLKNGMPGYESRT